MTGFTIEARDLGKTFGLHQYALRHVDLVVRPGTRVAIFGPNGAGKTTLLKLMGGLLRPSEGWLRVGGVAPSDPGPGARARALLGILSHQTYLYDELTPTENLLLYGRLYGLLDLRRRVAEALDGVGMAVSSRRPLRHLSRGMQQKVQIAAILLHEPELLILDEPFSGLDPVNRSLIIEIMKELSSRGTTLILSTHLMDQVQALCERIILVSHSTTS